MRLRSLAVLLLALLLPVLLPAAEYSARVVDERGRGIADVWIKGGTDTAFSDAEGWFQIRTEADSLSFARLGYHALSLEVGDLPRLVRLTEDPVSLPPIRVHDRYRQVSAPALDALAIYPDTNSAKRSTADILLEHYSFSSSDVALSGEYQSLSILGNLSRHTLVLIDGIAVNAAGEAFDFSRIPASQISHIEIIKGSSSVYGGSSAIGGIVNIITLSPAQHAKAEIQSGLGSFGMNSQRYLAAIARRHFSLSLEYSHYFARNDFVYEPTWDSGTEYRRIHNRKRADYFFAKSMYHGTNHYWEMLLTYDSYLRELPGPISFPELYDAASQRGANLLGRLSQVYQFSQLDNELSLSFDHKTSSYTNLESSNPIAAEQYRQLYLSPLFKDQLSFDPPGYKLELSAELRPVYYRYQDPPESGFGFALSEYQNLNSALYGRIEKELERGSLSSQSSLALRQDWAQDEAHTSWRVEQHSTLYLPPLELGLQGSIGTAFSLPSYFDMHWIGDSQTQGNDELNSETSFGYHLGLNLRHRLFELRGTYYYNDIEQLIQWRQYFLNGSTWRPFNVGRAKISNWEYGLSLFPHQGLSFDTGITFTKARDFSRNDEGEPSATYDKYLPYTPQYKGTTAVKYSHPSFGTRLSYLYVGKQYSTVDNLIGSMDAFALLNFDSHLNLSVYAVDLLLDLKLNNLLDHRYEIYAHIPQPGFNWSLGLSLSYKLQF